MVRECPTGIDFVGIALVAIALAAASACGGTAPAGTAGDGRQVVVDVATARAAWVPVTRQLRVTGSLTADEEAEVAAETAGRVVETPVERGSRVEEGSPLVRLVQTEAQASLQEAEANVAQIEVRLGVSAEQAFDVERVPEVSNARAARDLAAAEYGRIKKLYDDHVVSGSEYDQRRTQVELTERQYDMARNGARQLYRSLEGARARLALARKAFADTAVRSPFAGLVVERKVSVGDFVTRGTKVVTVMRINPLRVELTVPEQYLSTIRTGQSLELAVDAYPGRTFKGQVRFVSPALRADQRALTIEAIVPNADGALKPGLFASAAIQQPGNDRALCVPSAAVRNLAGSTRLYVIKGDRVEERMVTLGQAVGDAVEIANGIAEGDEVAQTNVDRLVDGGRVRVGRAPGAHPAATTVSEPVSGRSTAGRSPATTSR
jgi:membrane fusion protein (multidrug efflux system)